MGLDMYLHTVDHNDDNSDVDQKLVDPVQIGYWRKANHIHGWMEDLYRTKGGSRNDFNCDTVKLTISDLLELSIKVLKNDLEPTEGFFFGNDNRPEEGFDLETIDIIIKAINEIEKNNKDVYYSSWW